ncbi:9725_t:CDS:10 [Diversispora eburnea]|uniref:1-phosphatidylinositol 4-kinase n=1 Tax=Diversispora eburnea TaxID=1213867 RepID=A0A9N8V6T1_9GLOM|nr:9725_t:CDS:10 [Diversispora eburnea]
MLNGLFRTIQLSHFPWNCNDFESLAHQSQLLIHNDCLKEVVLILETVIQSTDLSLNYAKKTLLRYSILGYPLSNVWNSLVTNKMEISKPVTDYVRKALRKAYVMSLQYFSELTIIMSQNNDCPAALYAREIMSATSVLLHEVDDELISKFTSSLSIIPRTPDLKVQISALDAATILALNFPQTSTNMIQIIRKFLTTPSTIFELAVTVNTNLTIQQYGIERLAHCLKVMSQDISHSVIYNLLATLSGSLERTPTSPKNLSSLSVNNLNNSDQASIHSNEELRHQMLGNIIYTATGVARILKDDNVPLDETILEEFVNLALISSEKNFVEIVRKFSDISRQSLSPDNKIVTTAVLRCQQNLAERISCRPEFYEIYLLKILSLFVEKGVSSLAGEIGILLPVLKILLSHKDFKLMNASEELVGLFRNLWFHCVLYGFVSEDSWMREWRDSLIVIAQKTPPLVQESARNYLESDLEFNSVLVRGNSDQDLYAVKNALSSFLPSRAYEIKSFSFAEITFLLSVYHIEMMRSFMGQFFFIQRYFVNEGVNSSKLIGCMEEICNQECSNRAIAHTIDDDIRTQVRNLMIATCHRLNKVHQLAIKHLDSLMIAFPSFLCDKKLLFLLLELIELVWQSCEAEYENEYSPIYTFTSIKVGVTLNLTDSYTYRREMLSRLCENSKKWLSIAMARAPSEIRGLLEDYLKNFDSSQVENSIHMGRSIALEIGKTFSKLNYSALTYPRIPTTVVDNISEFIKDYSARNFYLGQVIGAHKIEFPSAKITDQIINEQKQKMRISLQSLERRVRNGSHVSFKELNRKLHFVTALLVSMPKPDEELVNYVVWIPIYLFTLESIKMGIYLWNWIINEKPILEKRVMTEISLGWNWSVRNRKEPFESKMQYAPSDKATRNQNMRLANLLFGPHLIWIQWLSGRFQAFRYRCAELVHLYVRFFQLTLDECENVCNHALSREGRLQIIILGFRILQSNRSEALIEHKFREGIYKSAFSWFSLPPRWIYDNKDRGGIINDTDKSKKLLLLFLESEINNLITWINPSNSPDVIKDTFTPHIEKSMTDDNWKSIIRHSWTLSPSLSVQMAARIKQHPIIQIEVQKLLANHSVDAVRVAEALPLLLVPPITAVSYFSTNYNNHSLILQYAMRALEYYPVDLVFFYIPQIVQALRFDNLGYVERFILGAAKISQLFAHQIIWNMNANMYKDDECLIPDPLKPTLDRIIDNIVNSLSGEDKAFYEREFKFFGDVTSISGKLKPYIKKSKSDKKAKIDEEMAKIKVDVGVYLPSNPEGKVVGIDYKSGRPLQIGDDCRQDVLALQLIAIFQNIFTSAGLDLYLFPYRIVATAPGCGVIDVIPNSISRDQLGREKVNSLYEYGVDSIAFEKARNCFIQACAAYSVVSFLLQIKDRHNGNIMLDDEGHIIHIDFGFILDIAPGGITFESSPFKLTTEMIQVMGGSADNQQFKWFSELCIKAYLAARPYAENICQVVGLMLGSGLPCFKGDTLKRIRDRFQIDKTERRAADYMIEKINQSFENKRTVWYDSFQKATNEYPDEIIILNVGGVKYETYRSTLTAYPETFLGTMFQERNQELLNSRNGNEYFFDRSGQIFHYVMQFYRTGKICYGDQIGPMPISLKEIETELDFFQIPRSTASAIDKVVITKVTNLINAFKQLIKEVAEIYMKESSFKNFKAEMQILFLDNGQATVNVDKKGISDIFENTKNYAYYIMALYKDEIKSHLENEYPELTWVHQHTSGEDLQYWKIRITIDWNLNYEKVLANVLNI